MVLYRKSLPAIGLLCCEYPSRAYINTAFLQKQVCGAYSRLKMPGTFFQHFKSFKTTAASHSFSQAQKPRVCVCGALSDCGGDTPGTPAPPSCYRDVTPFINSVFI